MPVNPKKLCPCHGKPMYQRPDDGRHECAVKRLLDVQRYQKTRLGQAARNRYATSDKARLVNLRYRRTAKGRAMLKTSHAKRIFIGAEYVGRAPTVDEAVALTAYARRQVRAFKERQRGADSGHPF